MGTRYGLLFAPFLCACMQLWTASGLRAEGELRATDVTNAVNRAMRFLEETQIAGGSQYSDYVVFCGSSVEQVFPQHKEALAGYKQWVVDHGEFEPESLYHSACHVMALDMVGEREQAAEIFAKLKPLVFPAEGRLNPLIGSYHLGWYLYGAIVTGDTEFLDRVFTHLSAAATERPDNYHYFSAYCLLKALERTEDERYRDLFLAIADTLKRFAEEYCTTAATDGHMGMALYVFCRAFGMTEDEEYRRTAERLAGILLAGQAEDGSWNGLTAYTIMPAEGLTAYLKMF